MSSRGRDALAIAALFAAALALRLGFAVSYDEDLDALRFRLGVERFDVAALRPHAPFYPVYVAAAKLVAGLGASPRGALAIVGAIAGAAVVAATALLAREILGRRAALAAGALALGSPFLWLSSEKLLSDMAGAAAFTVPLWLSARARRLPERAPALRTAALVILGVALGVRLSYFPIALAVLWAIARAEGGGRAWIGRARDILAGVALWLGPLIAVAGPRALVTMSVAQGTGHFTRWGGSAITVPSPAARLGGAAWGLWANVLGGAWPDAPALRWIGAPILVILLGCSAPPVARALRRKPHPNPSPPAGRGSEDDLTLTPLPAGGEGPGVGFPAHAAPEIALAAAAYLAWALLGQNVAGKPRHLLPLAPLLIVALAAGAEALLTRTRVAIAAVVILAAQWFADGARLAAAHREPSPAAALVAHLAAAADERPVLTRDLGPMIADGAPGRRIVAIDGDRALVEAAIAAGPGGALVTSEALSREALEALAARGLAARTAFARPRSRYVDPLWSELALFEIVPSTFSR